ncbi:MAG: hypothetical protein IT376_01695 [Polyangiaceae bacterium]|nr:hypothetical protein [Polyangiaceae bacterium]
MSRTTRRQWLVAAGAALGALAVGPRVARAGVARAVTLEELVALSRFGVVATPVDAFSRWETIGKRKRIVTYTRLRIEEALLEADDPGAEQLVRTLGGQVGEIGQIVHGEAVFTIGERTGVFLQPLGDVLTVTALAQGHYPLRADSRGALRLAPSPRLGSLVGEESSAVRRLVGRTASEARDLVRGARGR